MKINYTWRSEASEKETLNTRFGWRWHAGQSRLPRTSRIQKEIKRKKRHDDRKKVEGKQQEKGNWNETRCGSKPSRGREARTS